MLRLAGRSVVLAAATLLCTDPARADDAAAQPATAAAPPSAAPSEPVQLSPQLIGPSPASSGRVMKATASAPEPLGPARPDTRGDAMRAYQAALGAKKLGGAGPLTTEQVREALASAEAKLADGRRDEAIGDLVYLVESPRFEPFKALDEGRSSTFLLGDALARAGAIDPARAYLTPLLQRMPLDVWARRATRSLVDLGLLADHPEQIISDLAPIGASAPEEIAGDVAYLRGRAAQRAGKDDVALSELARVSPRSRFWAQATYLSGTIETSRGHYQQGERQFCKVADVKQTPREALAFGGADFFEVRDLARLGLGRVAHEQYRFDDSRYYYYLVPNDSAHLPEALYEAANSRYEAKDYRGARDLLDEMRARGDASRYDDEVQIFDAYVDLSLCKFPSADEKLRSFIAKYEPIRDVARRTGKDPHALADLVLAVRTGADPEALGALADKAAMGFLGAALRADPDFGSSTRRLAELDHQMSGLRQAMAALDDAKGSLASERNVRPRQESLSGTRAERSERVEAQLGEVRRLLQHVQATGEHAAEASALAEQLSSLESRARDALLSDQPSTSGAAATDGLSSLIAGDRERATALYQSAERSRGELLVLQLSAARDALDRLDLRLSRLLRRARLGRIETVLGKKRGLEIEVEALSEGYLPRGAVDSLEAARYLRDDEEYWPYDGEDWADEYVGGEGLE